MTPSIPHIIQENKKRIDFLFAPYDPIMGINSLIPRFPFFVWKNQKSQVYLPMTMKEVPVVKETLAKHQCLEDYYLANGHDPKNLPEFIEGFWKERMKHDFEFFAIMAIHIEDKISGQIKTLRPRYPQRRIIAELERQRISGEPIRVNIPKSRQFGSTTVIESYIFWIQNIVMENWHAGIAAHVDDAAKNIRQMYSTMAKQLPDSLGKITLVPYAKSSKNQQVKETGSVVAVGSSQSPDNLRGYSFKALHLSEVAYYISTKLKKPEDLARTLASTVPLEKNTIIVRESTCNGVGTYWHKVCLSSYEGKSKYSCVFVPFYEIEIYHKEIPESELESFIKGMSEYDWYLWEQGATLESIKWYNHFMLTEEYDEWRMKSEYPSNFLEAFQSSGTRVFPQKYVQNARRTCTAPIWKGDVHGDSHTGPEALKNVEFHQNDKGNLWVWAMPETYKDVEYKNRYCVSMDIGGTSEGADFSVIRVIDRYWMLDGGCPEIVATWRGKIDQDMLAWKAVQIATLYNKALFIPEFNSLQKSKTEHTEGNHFLTILDEIVSHYYNIFCRTKPELIKQGSPKQFGFHTNHTSKTMVINVLKAALRDMGYIEKDSRACDEFDMYEYKPDGTMGNVDGSGDIAHDDIVMATAILLWCAISYMPPIEEISLAPMKKRAYSGTIADF